MKPEWTLTEIEDFLAGRLSGADADRIEAAIESDPAAQSAALALGPVTGALDATLREAFAAPLGEPVPAALLASVLGEPGRVRAMPRRRAPWVPAAIAASLALAVGLGSGWGLGQLAPQMPATPGIGPAHKAVAAAFDHLPSGGSAAGVGIAATFRDGTGRLCREFETLDAGNAVTGAGVACRTADGWRILMLAAGPEGGGPSSGGFATAGGRELDPVSDYLTAIGAGEALAPEAEQALIDRGWR